MIIFIVRATVATATVIRTASAVWWHAFADSQQAENDERRLQKYRNKIRANNFK